MAGADPRPAERLFGQNHCVISGFRREADDNCTYWTNMQRVAVIPYRLFATTHRSHRQGSDMLFRDVGKELPLLAT
jgi:hypothetical protein